MVFNDRDAETLRNVRRIYTELQQLRKELKEQREVTLHSPALDGMPKGNGHADQMVLRLIRIEGLEKREAILVRKVEAARVRAYHACKRVSSAKASMFFEAYCADLRPIETAQKFSGVDDQTARKYLKLLGEEQ